MWPFLAILIVGTIVIIRQNRTMPYRHNTGFIFGTVYNVTYQYDHDLNNEILLELEKVDNSLSMFNRKSIISQINDNKNPNVNDMFADVFILAQNVSKETNGAFDITVAPLVNAWGFGFKNNNMPTIFEIFGLRFIFILFVS